MNWKTTTYKLLTKLYNNYLQSFKENERTVIMILNMKYAF